MRVENRKTVRLGTNEGRAARMPGARLVTRKVSAGRTGGAYSLFEVEVGPGGGEGPHVQHREDECLYVLEGLFGFFIEDERIEAGPGSLVYVPKGTLHAHRNEGEGVGRLLAIHTPGGTHESFVEEAGEPIANGTAQQATEGPTDAEWLAAVGAQHGIEIVPPPP